MADDVALNKAAIIERCLQRAIPDRRLHDFSEFATVALQASNRQ